MLVLTRKKGEGINLYTEDGRRIKIVVLGASSTVRLGIDAPKDIPIVREEIDDESSVRPDQNGGN